MTQSNDTATLTAEAFVAGLPAKGITLCMGLGRRAPKGELGMHAADADAKTVGNIDPDVIEQFNSLPRAQVWIAALAQHGITAALEGGDLGLATPLGTAVDGETLAYWEGNLPSDFRDEIVQELRTRGAYFASL
jgi:hypothetical protein